MFITHQASISIKRLFIVLASAIEVTHDTEYVSKIVGRGQGVRVSFTKLGPVGGKRAFM